jgi:hypothetical protein
MGASTAQRTGRDLQLKDGVELLELALVILDSKNVSPDIGARLQDVIDQLKNLDTQD